LIERPDIGRVRASIELEAMDDWTISKSPSVAEDHLQQDYDDVQRAILDLQIHPNQVVDRMIPSLPGHRAVCRGSSLIHFPKPPIRPVYHSMTRWRRKA